MKKNKTAIVSMCLLVMLATAYLIYKVYLADDVSFRSAGHEYEQISKIYDSMSDNLKMLGTYKKTQYVLLDEINRLNILQTIYQEEIINILNYAMRSCNINAGKITFSEIQDVSVDEGNRNNETCTDENISEQVARVTYMVVNAEFTSTYDVLMLFIDKLQDCNNDVSITNIQIMNSDGGEIVQCVISLKFYAMHM